MHTHKHTGSYIRKNTITSENTQHYLEIMHEAGGYGCMKSERQMERNKESN